MSQHPLALGRPEQNRIREAGQVPEEGRLPESDGARDVSGASGASGIQDGAGSLLAADPAGLWDGPREWFVPKAPPVLGERAYRRCKRAMDFVVALLLLPIVLPVIALCAVAIRLDSPGPVFFVQDRTGKAGRRFRMLKLRTMVRDAEKLKKEYADLNQLGFPDFKISEDPRITRVGRALRRTSLDELPQVLNVLMGHMSLVGPRPTSFGPETYSLWHTARLTVRPGITGLWQVSGRDELEFDERLRLDIAYIRNRCLWLDLRILLRTFGAVCGGRGAH